MNPGGMFLRRASGSVLTAHRDYTKPIGYNKHRNTFIPRVRGIEIIRDGRTNKGMAFSLKERQILGLHGLLPPAIMDQDQQASRVMKNLESISTDLDRYVFLTSLHDRNEKLFYRVLCENVEQLMPIVYTPTVGEACRRFGFIYRKPKGLYITIHDRKLEQIEAILRNWPERKVRAVVVTDGERILGLGDLGACGMGIPVGKLNLYVALAGIQPQWCLPVHLDNGTNNPQLLDDPFYIGLRHERITDERYDELVENFFQAVVRRFGQKTLIQFEDFAGHNAFRFLEDKKDRYCTFNDDIQGTASVVVAGLLAATRVTGKPLTESKFLFFGSGGAACGIANGVVGAMIREGLSEEEARSRVFMINIDGLVTKQRIDKLADMEKKFAQDHADMPSSDLLGIVKAVKPTALIGASTVPQVFTEEVIGEMAKNNERPIVFALSNPTSKAECTAEQAYQFSEGRVVFASGSPFPPVEYNGKTYHPGQGNNSYIFPGVALATVICGVRHITDEMFLIASETLAKQVSLGHLDEGRVYPPLKDCREISVQIATAISEYCYENGLAAAYPEPEDKEAFIRSSIYDPSYDSYVPQMYDWPSVAMKTGSDLIDH